MGALALLLFEEKEVGAAAEKKKVAMIKKKYYKIPIGSPFIARLVRKSIFKTNAEGRRSDL